MQTLSQTAHLSQTDTVRGVGPEILKVRRGRSAGERDFRDFSRLPPAKENRGSRWTLYWTLVWHQQHPSSTTREGIYDE